MGTNYYLKKKAEYIPVDNRPKVLGEKWYETYDFDFMNYERNKVDELTNGFVYNNTYYPTVKKLNEDYYITYHIGKKSYGWRFLLSSYISQHITTLDDWIELFKQQDNKIVNEYGEEITPQEMISIILGADLDAEKLEKHSSSSLLYSTGFYDVSNHWDFS